MSRQLVVENQSDPDLTEVVLAGREPSRFPTPGERRRGDQREQRQDHDDHDHFDEGHSATTVGVVPPAKPACPLLFPVQNRELPGCLSIPAKGSQESCRDIGFRPVVSLRAIVPGFARRLNVVQEGEGRSCNEGKLIPAADASTGLKIGKTGDSAPSLARIV